VRRNTATTLIGILAAAAGCTSKASQVTAGSSLVPTTTETTETTLVETTTTSTAAPAATTTSTAKPAVKTTTTAKPVVKTTTTAKPAQTFTISPSSGGNNTAFTASGTGCKGAEAGISITAHDPSGTAFNGDGGAAHADGTWRIPMNFYAAGGAAGRYKYVASCTIGGAKAFTYAPQYFTFTG